MTTIAIENLTSWSPPKRVETKNGPRNLRKGPATESFWAAWRSGKDTLKAAGVSCGQQDGRWEACWWLPIEAAEQAKIEEAQQQSRAVDSAVVLLKPEGQEYLGYQKAGIAYSLSCPNALIADEQGLGKTIQAIGVFNNDPTISKVLIVCPASLRLNWKREFSKWTTRPVRIAIINGGKPSDFPKSEFDILITNFDVVGKHRKMIDMYSWDLLVVDEAHNLKNPKSLRTKAVLGAVSKGKRTAEAIKARRRIFLTGTPIVNRPVELWPLVEALDPEGLGKKFFNFAKRFCNAQQTRYGWDFSGASNLDLLQRLLREKCMVRRLKADVLTELPAKRRQVIEIPANGSSKLVAEEKRVYDSHRSMLEALEERLAEAETRENYDLEHEDIGALRSLLNHASKTAFTEMSGIRHEVALAKVPHVVEHVRESLENGPVVLFVHHKDVVAQIAAEFPGCVTLTGETSMENRQKAVDDFQAGRASLFIGNIQAAGVGITLTRSAHVIFAELDWVPGNLSQAEDRCHRIGQTESVLVQHIVLEDSMDADMAKKLIVKQEVITTALDNKEETNYGTISGSSVEVIEQNPVVVEIRKDKIDEQAEKITDEQATLILQGLRRIAGVCDGAREQDGCGFNRYDTNIGKSLASQTVLSKRQCVLGRKLCIKYQRQLGMELVAIIKGIQS